MEVELSQETTYAVEGLTCSQCLVKVMDHVRGLPGVDGVAIDLVKGGESAVVISSSPGAAPQAVEAVEAAVTDAGFDVTGHWPGVHQAQQDSMTRPGAESAAFDSRKVTGDER